MVGVYPQPNAHCGKDQRLHALLRFSGFFSRDCKKSSLKRALAAANLHGAVPILSAVLV